MLSNNLETLTQAWSVFGITRPFEAEVSPYRNLPESPRHLSRFIYPLLSASYLPDATLSNLAYLVS